MNISEAISKYGGEDEAYKLKLKTHIRNGMGYSNYMSRIGAETQAPESLGDVKGLSPAGIKARIASRFGDQNRRISSLQGMAGDIDTTAGSLASAQVAREKAAATTNPFGFKEGDWLDEQIKQFITDRPKNAQGQPMTAEEFKQQLLGKQAMFAENPQGEGDMFQPGYTPEMIEQRMEERIPKDYSEKSSYYQALAAGSTKAEAEEVQDLTDYSQGKMSDGRKKIYEILNPSAAARAEEDVKFGQVREEVVQKDEEGRPKYKLQDLISRHPELSPEEVKRATYSFYRDEVQGDIETLMSDVQDKVIVSDNFKNAYINGVEKKKGLDAVKSMPEFVAMKEYLSTYYGEAIKPEEVERMMSLYILSKI